MIRIFWPMSQSFHPKVRCGQKTGPRPVQQVPIAARMILMVMGVCDINQGKTVFIDVREDRFRRSAVHSHGAG